MNLRPFLLLLLLIITRGATGRTSDLIPYLPEGRPWAAVIVCPGGSYSWLDMSTEGHTVARWLQANGIAAFVLKYRVQGVPAFITHARLLVRGHRHPDQIADLQEAILTLRLQAEAYGLPADRIGVMGFSAGGHLAMLGAELSATDFTATHTDVTSLRLDFVASIYPVVTMAEPCVHKRSRRALLGEYGKHHQALRDSLSLERHVPRDCPPVFLVNCDDDPVVHPRNAQLLDSALTAQGVPHRYICYRTGGHGFGASEEKGTEECRQWKPAFLRWLREVVGR